MRSLLDSILTTHTTQWAVVGAITAALCFYCQSPLWTVLKEIKDPKLRVQLETLVYPLGLWACTWFATMTGAWSTWALAGSAFFSWSLRSKLEPIDMLVLALAYRLVIVAQARRTKLIVVVVTAGVYALWHFGLHPHDLVTLPAMSKCNVSLQKTAEI